MNLNIYQEAFLQFINILKTPLAILADPTSVFIFILLPAIVFIAIVRIVKPKKLLFRIFLPIIALVGVAFIGIFFVGEVGGGFFSLIAISQIFSLTIISMAILFPFCSGIVLRGNERYYTLIYPITIYSLLLFTSDKTLWNFVEGATMAVILLPISHIISLAAGTYIGGNMNLPIVDNEKTLHLPLLHSKGPLVMLTVFLLLWSSLFYYTATRFSLMISYGAKSDTKINELSQLNPMGLIKYGAGSVAMSDWNAGYEKGLSPFEVQKFDFSTGAYNHFKTILVDIRQTVGDDSGKVSPDGSKVAKFENGGFIAFYGENGFINKYSTDLKVGMWIKNQILWSPNAKQILINVCTQGETVECKDYSIVDPNKGVNKIPMNLKEVRWIDDVNLIGADKKTGKISIYNTINGDTTNLTDVFAKYRSVLPSPDMKIYSGITASGELEFCTATGEIISKVALPGKITGDLSYPYYYIQWSPDGKFLQFTGNLNNVIISREGVAYTPLYRSGQDERRAVEGTWSSN